jgi:2',3'-cyclic-nucleotide 2'-phosphodiesterase (5'-nucleotidase family)
MTATIAATNDLHSRLAGAAPLLARLRALRERGAVVVDAGDFFGASAFYEHGGGGAERRVASDLYDYLVPGNHDLTPLAATRDARFPTVLCANLRPRAPLPFAWQPSALVTHTSPRLGIVGFVGEQVIAAATADELRPFHAQEPAVALLRRERDALLRAGAEVVVGVSHSGFLADVELQETHGLFDTIFSSHCHSERHLWASGPGPQALKAPDYGAGCATVTWRPGGGRASAVEWTAGATGHEPWLADAVGAYERWAREPLGRYGDERRTREHVTRAVAAAGAGATGCAGFVLNGGAIRTGLPAAVDRAALVDCAPFDTPLAVVQGHQLEALSAALTDAGEAPAIHHAPTGTTGTVATTAYVVERLGLSDQARDVDTTLRELLMAVIER